MADEYRKLVFHGNVQGVGFRWTTNRIASGHAVKGYVRNQPDGTVQLVAEGAKAELDAFQAEIQREMGQYIRDTQVQKGPATGNYSGFTIRH